MQKIRLPALAVMLIFIGCASHPQDQGPLSGGENQQSLSLRTLVEKNVQAAGGFERLASINNIVFTLGTETVYVTANGQMKITVGKAPVISEVTLVDKDKVVKNCFNEVTYPEGSAKSTYQIQAMLRSGLYTLAKLEKRLQFEGLKRFGPAEYYGVSAHLEGLKVDFYLDSDTYTIKRIVFQGQDAAGEKYERSQDFGPYQTIDGINLPATWYSSQVGARGEVYTLENVAYNKQLDDGMFTDYAVNVGKAVASPGALSGQVVDVARMGNYLIIYTNWTPKCIQQAGFGLKDRLMLDVSDKKMEVVLEEGQPSRSAMATGQTSMFPSSSGPNYVILITSPEGNDIYESLAPLQAIHIKSKT